MIYFVQAATGHIKIGYATNIKKRLAELQVSQPAELTLLGVREGGRAVEAEMHRRFSEHHAKGEWFYPADGILQYIAAFTTPRPVKKRFDRRLEWQGKREEERRQAWLSGAPRYSRYGYGKRRFTSASPRPE